MLLLRCYPKITDWIYHISGQSSTFDFRFLPFFSYGFFVAMAFLAAATIATRELKRREKLGLLKGVDKEITVGSPPSVVELALYFVFGFLTLFKVVGLVTYHQQLSNYTLSLKEYLLSLQYGSWAAGIIGGALVTYYYYQQKKKEQLPQPVKKKITIFPSDSMGDLVIMGAILGVLGSNLFNFFEDPTEYSNFWSDPVNSLFSGLSIYGGLICSAIGFLIYAYIRKFNILHFFDALAPSVILANGIGRLGCQVAGDGDWGIANLHPKPSWIPEFLWSSRFENNIIDADPTNFIPGCTEEHCHYLTNPVYPTSIYEFLMCFAIFVLLWWLGKRLTYKPGIILSLFAVLIGIQRYSIEQLRDISGRELYHIFGFALKQSEVISIILFVIGVGFTIYLYFVRYKNQPNTFTTD